MEENKVSEWTAGARIWVTGVASLAGDVETGSFDWGLEADLGADAACLAGVFLEGVFTAGVALLKNSFAAAAEVLAGVDFLAGVLALGVAFLPFSAFYSFYLAVLFSPTAAFCFFSVDFLA